MPQNNRQRDFPKVAARAKRLRRKPTPAEARLWKHLRKMEGFHFRRQLSLGEFVFDFGDHGRRLLVEVDGSIHALPEVAARDAAKEAWAKSQGYALARIPNDHVFGDGEWAIAAVLAAAEKSNTGKR